MINIYIVDDHPFVREGLKTFINTRPDMKIIGEAGNGEEAVFQIPALKPDIAVVDLRLPGMDGIELTKHIRRISPNTKVIILSSFCKDDDIIEAIDAGAIGYLMKDSAPGKLIDSIISANNGDPVLHPRILKRLMNRVTRPKPFVEELTTKEKEVLTQLVKGKSNKEIAYELSIFETTIKTHVSSILRKMDVKDRTQAVIKAIEYKMVEK